MKNLKILVLVFFVSFLVNAQKVNRIAYVDIDYILENLNEYKVANEQFAEKVNQWKKEFEEKNEEINKRKQKLEAERPLLTAEMVTDREEEIQLLENNLKALQQKRFGAEKGDYIQQKWQLAQPIQDQIFNIAQEVAKARNYDFIFTKDDISSIHSDQKFDITKMVLRLLNRKDNAEDRNKDMSVLLKENYDYDLKDEKTKRKEEALRKRAEKIAEAQAVRKAKKEEQLAQKQKQIEERKRILEEKQKERERILEERKQKQTKVN